MAEAQPLKVPAIYYGPDINPSTGDYRPGGGPPGIWTVAAIAAGVVGVLWWWTRRRR